MSRLFPDYIEVYRYEINKDLTLYLVGHENPENPENEESAEWRIWYKDTNWFRVDSATARVLTGK